ncbi:metallophosphoesterase [Prevotella sp.]|jgi:predicted MPP superfamily phosphohydrolase|uniref:metallophosphoesterase n=1 Tax=Prevotella sp. TaxID=59823 RepID=UPI0025F7FB59|nr:metallophosphoesterase [Prevotella sp.]
MIARISIIILLVTLLPDIYMYRRYVKRRLGNVWARIAWWLPTLLITVSTIGVSLTRDFAPHNLTLFNTYLFITALVVLPKFSFVLCSLAGRLARRMLKLRRNWGNYVGLVLVLAELYILFHGTMVGTDRLNVRQVTIEFDDLPKAFDGYRIAQFTDVHLGSMKDELMLRAVTAIDDMRPDLIVFTGDIQNMGPDELPRFAQTLKRLKAKDGVMSVLGNHDYSRYVNLPPDEALRNERMTRDFETSVGWQLLLNDNRIVRRGSDSIVIAGGENDGRPPFPAKADLKKAMRGIHAKSFVVMLQHDPSAWRRHILPLTNAQLTLSGHTHGGQISLFGLRPTELVGKEDDGLYVEGKRKLFVSTGLGGFVPFRFYMNPEVVEITLKKTNK